MKFYDLSPLAEVSGLAFEELRSALLSRVEALDVVVEGTALPERGRMRERQGAAREALFVLDGLVPRQVFSAADAPGGLPG